MSTNAQDYDFDEYDKPGTERSRRRRGEDDDLESDLEEELLDEDWLSGKKTPNDVSDEELNDDLLQSDDEDHNMSGQDVSLNAPYDLDISYSQQEAGYTDDVVNLGADGCEEGDVGEEGYQEEGYVEEYSQDAATEMPVDYTGDEGDDGYQDEVLDIQINEPLDGDFQDDEYQEASYNEDGGLDEHGVQQEEGPMEEELGGDEQQQEEEEVDTSRVSQVFETDEVENETVPEQEEAKEESDEEDDDDEESGRLRFKSERKDGSSVRLADAGNKRRNIPETLELSEKAKQDLMEFEEQERQKRQSRHGGRGRGGRGRGGFPGFGMGDFRGHRGRMNDHRPPLMGNMGMQQSSRMPLPHLSHQQQLQAQQHHPPRPRGPPPFQDHGRPMAQQPLQPLIPPHMSHRSPPLRPQMEPPPRMMSSPPPNFAPHPSPQPKNIHINPHFRGPTTPSVQVPLMPPAQSQPRPAVGPQRFPGPGDFHPHMPGNFGQPQRPPHHMEPFRNQPHQGPPDREPLFMGERGEPPRFPGQHMYDHQGPSPLMNSNNNLHHQQQQQQQQMPGQGHMGFGPPGPAFNQPSQGSLGPFPREQQRPNLSHHQGHQGMVGLNQQGGPPNQPRHFMAPRQPFGQQGSLFPPPQFGMQVRLRGLMHGPPQLPHQDPMPPHQHMHQQQQQHHRQELPHHHHHQQQQQQLNLNEPRPMMHHGQNPFHQQQAHGSPRQMTPRPQNLQQRNMSNRQRMSAPVSKQMQILPQRNSNLRELPVAPGNTNMNSSRPTASPATNVRPVAKATQGVRPVQNTQPVPGGGRGRGQAVARAASQPAAGGRTVVRKEIPSVPASTAPQDPDEDEETRQYRLKIEEQKRLREEILRKKEMRRQMQAGVRKKELLDRISGQSTTPGQGPVPPQSPSAQQNQPPPHPTPPQQAPLQEQKQQQQQQQQQRQQQQQPQQPRQFPQRPPQALNQSLKNPNQGNPVPPNGATQAPRPNVKSRLLMGKANSQPPQQQQQQQQLQPPLRPSPNQQWKQPQQNQLQQPMPPRRIGAMQNVNNPSPQTHPAQGPLKNIPVTPLVQPGQANAQAPKPGTKRTVMQRTKSAVPECQQVPQKVRLVKLSGAAGKGPEATSGPAQQQQQNQQQQDTWTTNPLNQRKVTMTGQPQPGPGAAPQAGRGGMGNPQQNRVVVSGRGRGGGQMGRGRPMATRQSQRGGEAECCTVSIEGLSSSTTEGQLKNLLRSIGPIEMFQMMPQQRKAVATFSTPQHAASFQMSFHRHMIDLSHIDVSLIDG